MTENKYLKLALILGIIIILNLFFAYAMKVIYKEPQWDNFCSKEQIIKKIDTREQCLEIGGQWDENIPIDYYAEGIRPFQVEKNYCNLNFICNKEFKVASESYERNVFATLIVLGVISIVIGFMIASQSVISIAFSLGGVLTFIWASIRYWSFAGEYFQAGILGLALIVLIYLGIKKFK